MEECSVLKANKAGFRKGYSCADHISTLHSLFQILKCKKQKLYCAFVDFFAAFDKVHRVRLCQKLLRNAINGKCFLVINSMYNNIKSCISHNNNLSAYFPRETGVLQGENLALVLFALFLNDLQSYMENNGCVGVELNEVQVRLLWLKLLILLYAHDTVSYQNHRMIFKIV